MTGGDERCRGKVHGFKFLDEEEQRRLLATADEEVVQAWLAARPHIMFRRITPESEHASVRIPPQLRIRSDSAMGDGSSEEHKSDGWTLVAAKDFAAGEVVLEHTTELFDSNTITEIIVRPPRSVFLLTCSCSCSCSRAASCSCCCACACAPAAAAAVCPGLFFADHFSP